MNISALSELIRLRVKYLELKEGVICIGENTFRGQKQKAYLSADKEYRNCALVTVGPTRAGKTTLLSNIAKDAVDNNECVILFDFCGKK